MLRLDLERVLPRAARISVLGIPRHGWRGFESPAKFKLLAMEGVRCLGAWGRWTCLQHRTGAWVMHIEHQLAQIAEWECFKEWELSKPGLGSAPWCIIPWGTHTPPTSPSNPLDI